MNETTKNFLEVFNNLEPWSLPVVLYRLYYDEHGRPIEYSHEDKPGNYIDVDPITFRDRPRNVKVINGVLKQIDLSKTTKKLIPGDHGIHCDPSDVCVIINKEPCIKWSLKTYEPD